MLIKASFNELNVNNKKINNAVKKIKTGKATHQDSNEFAYESGKILAEVFKKNIRPEDLPDGKMYYNIADRVLNDTLGRNYKLISDYSADVQTSLNKSSGLRIKGVKPPKNQDRINGLIEKVQEKTYEETKWVLQEPIINFSQSIVDDTIKTNVDFHNKLGLRPKIVRKMNGKCCDWCKEVEGEYEYPNVPKDVFRRHRFCRCTVEYFPGDGRRQNIYTKKWHNPNKESLKQFRENQVNEIIDSRIKKDIKESDRARRILSNSLLGEEINGVKIKEVTEHISERIIERNIGIFDLVDGVKNPLEIGDIKFDSKNRPSFKVISKKVTFYINPEKGSITTVHKTGNSTLKKLKEKK